MNYVLSDERLLEMFRQFYHDICNYASDSVFRQEYEMEYDVGYAFMIFEKYILPLYG